MHGWIGVGPESKRKLKLWLTMASVFSRLHVRFTHFCTAKSPYLRPDRPLDLDIQKTSLSQWSLFSLSFTSKIIHTLWLYRNPVTCSHFCSELYLEVGYQFFSVKAIASWLLLMWDYIHLIWIKLGFDANISTVASTRFKTFGFTWFTPSCHQLVVYVYSYC